MGRLAKADRPDIESALVDIFRRYGFVGSTLRDLAQATRLKAASLYHRYPNGKTDMARAALGHIGGEFTAAVLAPLAGPGAPADRLTASARGVGQVYRAGTAMCLLAVLSITETPPEIAAEVSACFALWTARLADVLAEAGAAHPQAEAQDRIAAVQGGLLLARGSGDIEPFHRAVRRMAELPK